MLDLTCKYGFIVGNGDLPKIVLDEAKDKNLDFIVGGINGLTSKQNVLPYAHFWFSIGEIKLLIDNLKKHQVKKIVMVGSITRPSLFSIKLDSLGKELISKYINKIAGDNSILSMVIDIFENNEFEVIGAQDITDKILINKGFHTNINCDEYGDDITNGFFIAKELSKLDIGQSIVFQQNMVIAVEAVEGTREMILRSKKLLKKGREGILVKVNKVNQDNRVDLPSIGTKTIIEAKKAGLKGIVIEANKSIIINKEEVINLANKYQIFIVAI
jgi:DUF1009 family protein